MFFLRKGGIRLKILKKTGLYQVKKQKAQYLKLNTFKCHNPGQFHSELSNRNICPDPLFNLFFLTSSPTPAN
jgi:hypothetical protein